MAKKKTTKSAAPKGRSSKAKKAKKSGTKKAAKASTSKTSKPKKKDPRQRLQRVMAAAGVGSRRECEIIIEEGRVEIDGQIVMTLGVQVDPTKQTIFVDAQ